MAVPTTDELRSLAETLKAEGLVGEFLAQLGLGAPKVFHRTNQYAGNIFRRPMLFQKAGERVAGHDHNYDHCTYVVAGAVHAKSWSQGPDGFPVDVKEGTFRSGSMIQIPAKRWHEFTALLDLTACDCIFAHRDYKGEVVPVFEGFEAANL